MKKVLLIRHGESRHNAEGDCLSGLADTTLSDVGRDQAKRLGQLLESLPIDTVCSSPLCRAMETAQLALPSFEKSVLISRCLIEFDYGDYDGLPYAGCKDDDPIIWKWNHSPASLCFPNGDCISHHADQALKGLEELVSLSSGSALACFSHKTTIRLIVSRLLHIPLNSFRRVPCGNASITVLGFNKGKLFVENVNLTADYFTIHCDRRNS